MTRILRLLLAGLAALSVSVTALAADLTPDQQARAAEIGKSLRCVVCQNQSIEDSNAPLAADMRQLVRERIETGDTDEQIIAHLVDRYGTFVLMKPPVRTDTFLLWFGPLLFVVLGAIACIAYVRRGSPTAEPQEPLAPEEVDALAARLQSETRP